MEKNKSSVKKCFVRLFAGSKQKKAIKKKRKVSFSKNATLFIYPLVKRSPWKAELSSSLSCIRPKSILKSPSKSKDNVATSSLNQSIDDFSKEVTNKSKIQNKVEIKLLMKSQIIFGEDTEV